MTPLTPLYENEDMNKIRGISAIVFLFEVIMSSFVHKYDKDRITQRYYIQDGNSLTYNVSVKSRNLSIVRYGPKTGGEVVGKNA